jgi:hypothetical protein
MDSNPFSNSSILSALQGTLKLHSNRVGTAIRPRIGGLINDDGIIEDPTGIPPRETLAHYPQRSA